MVQQGYIGENVSATEMYKNAPESPLLRGTPCDRKDTVDFYLSWIRPSRPAEHTPKPTSAT